MKDKYFIDTNILVYANDRSSPEKQSIARQIIKDAYASKKGCLSTQVLQEFFVAATRKAGLPADNARAQVLKLGELETVLIDQELIIGAMDLHIIHKLSFWDALIVKSASAAGCRVLISEDLNHGQLIDGVKIQNPFIAH